ncbi:MAG TPA: hypothetical protein VMV69_20030 [Pirellulales bacterium]|nr:hypothetical protein [Pirellulales bacterium]
MEDVSPTTDADSQPRDEVLRTLAAQRARARDFVAAQERRLRQAEAELARQLALIGEELACDQRHTAQGQTQLAQGRSEVAEGQAELAQGRRQLDSALAKLRQEERELSRLRREHEADAGELARQRQRLQEKSAQVERADEALAAERQATKIQRRRIAQEFKAQRAARLKDLDRRRDEWKAELDGRRRQCEALEQQLAERAAEFAVAERRLQAAADQGESLQRRLTEALDAAAAERRSFESRLTEALEAASRAAAAEGAAAEGAAVEADDLADMKRRYEIALDDLRELRRRCAELELKLSEVPRASTAVLAGDGMDWEAQKRRMLAAWEANAEDDGDEPVREERLKLRAVIAETDAAMVKKEQELEDLRRLLAAASPNGGPTPEAVAAVDELLSHDETVRTERERLQLLQLEWEEKLRRAEIDLSVERAKMARQRADIEERHRQLQELQAQRGNEPPAAGKEKKPQRGRWLARLGLKEEDSG